MPEVNKENCELVIERAEVAKEPLLTIIHLAHRAFNLLSMEEAGEITLTEAQKIALLERYLELKQQAIEAMNNLP